MSAERTLMAWMRTAVSLIGFGFTIVQFFERLKTMAGVAPAAVGSEAPRYLGLALIGAGILGLIKKDGIYSFAREVSCKTPQNPVFHIV